MSRWYDLLTAMYPGNAFGEGSTGCVKKYKNFYATLRKQWRKVYRYVQLHGGYGGGGVRDKYGDTLIVIK